MNRLALLLIVLAAAGAGVAAWWGYRASQPAPPVARPLGAEEQRALDERLVVAMTHLKEADELQGPDRASRVAQARAILDELAGQVPQDERVAFWQGMAGILARDAEVARAAHARLRSLLGLNQRDPALRYLGCLVALEFDPGRAEGALKVLRSVKAEAPGFFPEPVERAIYRALLAVALQAMEPGRGDRAIAALEEAVALAEGDIRRTVEARRLLASAFERAGRYVEAQEQWEWLVERAEGRVADLVVGLANTYAVQNQWARAIESFDRALALREQGLVWNRDDAGLDELRLRRGNCYRLLERPAEARADFEAHLAGHPEDHRAMYWLATVLLDPLDEPAKARDLLEKARTLAPYCDTYLRLLQQVYEIRLADPARASAVRRELEEGAAAREQERTRLSREDRGGRFMCE